ncbi:hypothetical protein SAMN04488527_102149 [Aliiroseovarius crassostreae]|uniref:DUF6314 family protein n=1 Tax=Aliiroseovarius crassostreae TaxID=154981 RepID=UPI0008EED8DB|nr:DUF6314 family protein [Aliiroseovarius crassostreae]SFU41992.1 hypothetical protein SAMN04488527_102149 [Aliiroseovarius crassostreae]
MTLRLSDFEGRWHLTRRIEDAKAGSTGCFEGVATFTPDAEGLRYDEVGELRLPTGPNGPTAMQATRRYLWRPDADGVLVLFEDGRDFHRIGLLGDTATGFHHCPPDDYEVSYNFSRWPDWRATWRVTGPRKDYMMITDFRR